MSAALSSGTAALPVKFRKPKRILVAVIGWVFIGLGMTMLQFPVDEKLLAQAGVDLAHAGQEFRLLAAAKLFELRRVTLGQASELAGVLLWEFMEALGRFGVSWSNLTDEQIKHDIHNA